MNKEKLNLLEDYLKIGVGPLLVKDLSTDYFPNSVTIKANIAISDLNGHYQDTDFCPPAWYNDLTTKCQESSTILIIENISSIEVEDQTKFIELLKYNKISTFELPENCFIIVTCNDLTKINEEVSSLLVQI